MDKPKGVYLVAAWIFLGLGSFTLTPALRVYLPQYLESPQLIAMASMLFLFYLIIGVSLVKPLPRIITVFVFSAGVVFHLIGLFSYLIFGDFTEKAITIMLFKTAVIVPSAWCVYYLTSKKFKQKAECFLNYKKELVAIKFSNKQLSKKI